MASEEEEFKKKKVIPILKKLGFIEIRDNHGVKEFGKDVLFSKYDEFGHKKYYAAQIKGKDINGRVNSDIDDIIGHIRRAFTVPFTDLIIQRDVFIDELYIIISGDFKGNAIELIKNTDTISPYSRWTHFIDGNYVEQLFTQNFQEIQKLINETIREQKRNIKKCDELLDLFKKNSRPIFPLRKYNLEKLISEGEFKNDREEDIFYYSVDGIETMNKINDLLMNRVMSFPEDSYEKAILSLKDAISANIGILEEKLQSYSFNKVN